MDKSKAKYLGDGLYYEFDGYQVRLYTHDGINDGNEVFLEPEVIAALLRNLQIDNLIK
jgi:hypothetical protein